MKTAFVTPGPIDGRSGGYLYDRYLLNQLRKSGWKVDVHPLDMSGISPTLEDYDLIIEDELAHEYLTPLNRTLKDAHIISVVHNLSTSLKIKERDQTERKELAYFDTVHGFIANSRATAESVTSLTGKNMDHVIAYPGKDHMEYPLKRDIRMDPTAHILHVGNLQPYKGLGNLIRALAMVESSSWELDIAGRYDVNPFFNRKMRTMCRKFGLNTRIHLLGDLNYRQLKSAYSGSELFCMVSYNEGWGISIVEAMGFSLPVITTVNGGPSEIITDGREGFLVDPFDVETISDRITSLITDRELMAEMGSKARDRFLELPDWDESMVKAVSFLSGF